MMRYLLLLLIIFLPAGCAYHFPGHSGTLPARVERVQVLLFENHTSESRLENRLTNDVIEQLSRHRNIQLVESPEAADAVLVGRISSFSNLSYAYAAADQIAKYRATMVVEVELRHSRNDELLWSGRSRWSTEYDAAIDTGVLADQKEQALDELSRRLAEEIFYQLIDDF